MMHEYDVTVPFVASLTYRVLAESAAEARLTPPPPLALSDTGAVECHAPLARIVARPQDLAARESVMVIRGRPDTSPSKDGDRAGSVGPRAVAAVAPPRGPAPQDGAGGPITTEAAAANHIAGADNIVEVAR